MKTFLSLFSVALIVASAVFAADAVTKDTYPLTTCVVSGEDLGGMGDTIIYMHKVDGQPDREIRFCCKMCVAKFQKDPAKYLAKLDAAAATATSVTTTSASCDGPGCTKACCTSAPKTPAGCTPEKMAAAGCCKTSTQACPANATCPDGACKTAPADKS